MSDGQVTSKDKVSSAPVWLILTGLLLSVFLLLIVLLLSLDMIPGYPDTAEKSVAIYQSAAQNSAGLSVFLHPPLNSVQTVGHEQHLAFQFSNAGPDVHVSDLRLSSPDCLTIALQSPPAAGRIASSGPPPGTPNKTAFNLPRGQSAVYLYTLSASASCLGQFPLVFTYDWRPMTPEETAAQASGASAQKKDDQPATEHQSISTGPILVTTPGKLKWERLFSLSGKTVPIILLPVLLALATMLFQHLQQRRADLQKDLEDSKSGLQKKQEQRLQVWKTILPAFMEAVRQYYVPMLSIISVMTGETAKQKPAEADLDEVLAGALLLRNKFTNMIWHNGGFYFKNLVGEQLCTVVFDALMERCYLLAGDKDSLRAAAEQLPKDSTPRAVKEMVRKARANSPLVAMRSNIRQKVDADSNVLTALNSHLNLVAELLTYEANVPLFPWYEAPYKLNEDNLKVGELGLDSKTETALNAYIADIKKAFDEYVKSLPSPNSNGTTPPVAQRKLKPSQSQP